MWRNRLIYISAVAALAVLLFFSSEEFLFFAILLMIAAAAASALLIRIDAAGINVSHTVRSGTEEGRTLQLAIKINAKRSITVRTIDAEFEIKNRLFDTTETKHFIIELSDKDNTFKIPFDAEKCGELVFKCVSLKAYDMFGLFGVPLKCERTASCVVYPRKLDIKVEAGKAFTGSARDSITMQNRKGHDLSEVYDLRSYTEGDDIRSINWKLSSKLDELIVRQPSDPTRYNVALMPDLGLKGDGRTISQKDLNAAVAIGAALSEQFIKNSMPFCLIIPTGNGLEINEIRNNGDLQNVMRKWLQIKMQAVIGTGMKYFIMDNLSESFTKLIVISAGKVIPDTGGIEENLSVMIINATDEVDTLLTGVDGNCETVEFPSNANSENTYHIIC